MPGTQSVSVSGNGSTNTHYNWKQQRPVDLNNLSCICSTVSFRGNIPLVLACHVAFWYATNFHILTISIKNLLLIKKSSSLWKGSSCWLLLDLGTTWGSVGRMELNKWPRSSRMCSPCYNNSFYVACPASPWCDTAEPGQVNSCLTECSSYGFGSSGETQALPRTLYIFLASFCLSTATPSGMPSKEKYPLPLFYRKPPRLQEKGQVFFSLSSMFTSGPPTFIYCSKMCVCMCHSISGYPKLSAWSY